MRHQDTVRHARPLPGIHHHGYLRSPHHRGAAQNAKQGHLVSGVTLSENLQIVEEDMNKGVDVVSNKDKSFTLTDGFISSSTRKISNGSNLYRYTGLIPVKEGQHIITNAVGAASVIIIAAYSATDEVTALSDKSVVGENPITPSVHDYIVPSGVNAIRCCFRNDYVQEEDFYNNLLPLL